MSTLKTPQQYFSELVAQNRALMKFADAFEAARKKFEAEKGLQAPYSDSESFRSSQRFRK